jgi:tRNA-splicing ligase RtcB
MAPTKINDRLWSWASDLDAQTRQQAERTSRLPIVSGHVVLMPDAHLGLGATVGSVVPTQGAIIPACVGVDIGCGMAAVRTDLSAEHLPDDLEPMLAGIAAVIPAGMGRGHTGRHADARAERRSKRAAAWLRDHRSRTDLDHKQSRTALDQLGTLGSGNHFVEVSLDEDDTVWVVLHSGSRGIGNQLAQGHIGRARKVAKRMEIGLEDPDLAYFLEDSPEFDHYVADLLWAQDYAAQNRELMLDELLGVVFREVGRGRQRERVNCHHNYSALETHEGRELWVTRKGAIRAGVGDLGVIPGSMGTSTFVVEGLGNPASYESCSHGAGRRLSRTQARKTLSAESLATAMGDRTWLASRAGALVDEHPDAYKDITSVMRDQADLVTVRHELRQIVNYKG